MKDKTGINFKGTELALIKTISYQTMTEAFRHFTPLRKEQAPVGRGGRGSHSAQWIARWMKATGRTLDKKVRAGMNKTHIP